MMQLEYRKWQDGMKGIKKKAGGEAYCGKTDQSGFVCLFVLLFGDHSQKEKTGYKEDLYHDGRDLSAYLCSI